MIEPSKDHQACIEQFYRAFADRDASVMESCYHKDSEFEDPVFGKLNHIQTIGMWRMLIERGGKDLNIMYSGIAADAHQGEANWTATYYFGPEKRKVVNFIHASFEFKDGLIFRHRDRFSFRRWSVQALGLPGLLLGWTPFLHQKVHRNSLQLLEKYLNRESK